MTQDQATKLIESCAGQMDARYKKVVFDEWAILSLAEGKGHVLAYIGPRKEGFKTNFAADAGSLSSGLMDGNYEVGDFEFARHGVGTVSDLLFSTLADAWFRTLRFNYWNIGRSGVSLSIS